MRLTRSRPHDGRSLAERSVPARWWTIAGLLAALWAVFALDRATGSAPVQHLYYLPIIFAGMSFGMRGGSAAACAAIVLYHAANPHLMAFRYEHWDVLQIALFIAVGVITARLEGDARRLRVLATTDDLTGLHNLRSFEQRLASMVRASRETGTALSLCVLDVDRLKSLNDVHGHLAGAEAVRTIGHIMAAWAPPGGVACRYGGDEFVVALPRCAAPEARDLADSLRRQVNAAAPVLAGIPFPAATLSVSVGVACHAFGDARVTGSDDELGEALFRTADHALYQAKARGRNHIWVA